MKMHRKIISCTTLAALLFSFHLCACEEVLAVAESVSHADAGCAHHESSDTGKEHHDSDKGDDSSCCTNVLAVQSPTKLYSAPQLLKSPTNFLDRVQSNLFFVEYFIPGVQKFEFPPGESPPGFFLSAHFTHAPPTSL